MADFIRREKEFRKLNEKLDDDFKKSEAQNKLENFNETRKTQQNPLTNICYDTFMTNNMGNERFATYTKEKRSNFNPIRKIGGGDCATTPLPNSPSSPKTTKLNYGNTFNYRIRTLPKAACGSYDTNERKNQKYNVEAQNSTRNTSQIGTTRKPVVKETFVVYKNNKFTNSSSLDEMIKKNLDQTIRLEEENKAEVKAESNVKTITTTRADSTQPLESLSSCGGKGPQKIVNTSSLIRFLKSKVALLEESQARNIEEMTQQKEAYEEVIERHKTVQQQFDKALNRNATLTEQLEKMSTQLTECNRRSREHSQECLVLKKELDTVKRDLKHLTINYTNLEKRYARVKEESENAQKSCTSMRQSERELKENFRRETEAKDAEMKYLKKQRSDLFTAYKKQLFLIDNLRQQNVCMEQAKMIDFCEKEFSKILEWNLKP